MEMISRYIYAVTQRLPESQRADIAKELRGLIEDMLEERVGGAIPAKGHIEDVLLELGDPVSLADKYRGTKRYLIGPKLFPAYFTILKIVLFAIVLAMSVVLVIEIIFEPTTVATHIFSFVTSLLNASAMAFAWVTAGFAIAEYKGVIPKDLSKELEDWNPSELPPVPEQQKQIKRGEVIAGIVFTVIALVFVSISSHLIGIPIVLNNEFVTIIPIFNREAFVSILPLIYLFIGIGLLKECLKLISGQWTNKLAFSTLILNVISIGLVFIVFKNDAIWNPNFMAEMSRLTGVHGEAYLTIDQIWQRTTLSIYILFTIILIADTITAFYKTFKR